MKKISNDEALGLGVFFGLAVTGATLPAAITGGVLAAGAMYAGSSLKGKFKPPSPDS